MSAVGTAPAVEVGMSTTFASDLRQMMTEWDAATPAQRTAACAYASQRADLVAERDRIIGRLQRLETPCEASDRARIRQIAAELAR
jgi:hypothetical protein